MLTSRHALERKKNTTVGVIAGGEAFSRNNSKMSESRNLVRLLRMYFPQNWEFGSALSKLRNFGGGLNTPIPPPSVRRCFTVNRLNASYIHVILLYYIVFSSPCTASCQKQWLWLLAHFIHNRMAVGSVLTPRCPADAWQATNTQHWSCCTSILAYLLHNTRGTTCKLRLLITPRTALTITSQFKHHSRHWTP